MQWEKLLKSNAPKAAILIRLMVGLIFLSEGVQKFMFPADIGAGRFEKIGFSNPEFVAAFVGVNEIVFGTLVLIGFLTRLSVIPLIGIMSVAIVSTKVPILLDKGFWKMAHDARTDFSMLMGSIFLLIVGAGALSLDHKLLNSRKS
ncbi:DoxX family protein [Oligoflexus tunisiensis]|uniref:DoxX family protein n=1 Tax=Oligoflexus tunisiensis TaxID=708132 RepID=UPI00114CE39F|nr:DoxX family protein [Oligoflexus tunisiensis]